jgi:hypothetical protein
VSNAWRTRRRLASPPSRRRNWFWPVRDATDQSTATDRHEHCVEFCALLVNFEANHTGASRNRGPFEWMNKEPALFILYLLGDCKSLVHRIDQDDLRTVIAARFDACRVCGTHHDDLGRGTDRLRRVGCCNSMISSADSGNTDFFLLRTQRADGCERPTRLKGPCSLQELEFAIQFACNTQASLQTHAAQ